MGQLGLDAGVAAAIMGHQLMPSLFLQAQNGTAHISERSTGSLTGSRIAGSLARIPILRSMLEGPGDDATLRFSVARRSGNRAPHIVRESFRSLPRGLWCRWDHRRARGRTLGFVAFDIEGRLQGSSAPTSSRRSSSRQIVAGRGGPHGARPHLIEK